VTLKGNFGLVTRRPRDEFMSRANEDINARSTVTKISCKCTVHATWDLLRCVIGGQGGPSSGDFDTTPAVADVR
jgi:hypothetical protein